MQAVHNALHKRLDNNYSITSLTKQKPLYNFHVLDSLITFKERRKRQLSLERQEDYTLTTNNNCADKLNEYDSEDTNKQLLINYMKNTYGNELFDDKKYTCKGRVGIPSLPVTNCNPNAQFQSIRARLLEPTPFGTFPEDSEDIFEWLDANNSNADMAKLCARRAAAKIATKKDLPNWIFLYFRVRRVSWEFVVYEEKLNSSAIDLFSDNILDKWTTKIRFRMMRDAPMKYALMAFLARMGLEQDPDIVFCTDGFFGDMLVGGLKNKNNMPYRQISFNTTPEALGLQNGDNIFVVKSNATLRSNVETHIHLMRSRKADADDDDDEEDDDESERAMSTTSDSVSMGRASDIAS